ncbi:NAD(P)-binding domain-containing protein [Streptomyces sp. NPDC051639]|uniref:NAD(P)-binding domain-containing protein n=1 Tax=Streptomyces sp. NPDC051639 TaxID=3155671 RepID=UPI00344A95CE
MYAKVNETTRSSHLPVIGFIGLGGQGLAMARAIAGAGFTLRVWARRPATLDALQAVPYEASDTVEDLAATCEVIALCVRSDEVVSRLVQQMLPHLRPGTVVVNHGAGTPASAMRLTELCARRGVMVVDAPVSGGRSAAEERRLTTMVGGPQEAVRRSIPVFRSFSSRIVHLGAAGAGQAGNVFKDALNVLMDQVAAEDASAPAAQRLDMGQLVAALKLDSASSAALHLLGSVLSSEDGKQFSTVQALSAEHSGSYTDSGGTQVAVCDLPGIPSLLPTRGRGARAVDGEHAAVRKGIAIMRDRLAETLTLTGIAAEVHLSVYHFVRVFRIATGETPYRFLTRLRIELAQRLLSDTDLTVSQIANECGFSGPGPFSTAFLRHVGMRPSIYRRNSAW